ncbi:MAG: helix-turn-helix domain-containing protein [Eubacteriales bacterium]
MNQPIGNVIKTLRQEKHLTQKQLADALCISDKTVSKWERNMGLPDISMIPALSSLFNVDIKAMLTGDITPNRMVGGNMKQTSYFVCPNCHSLSLSLGESQVVCCGKTLAPLKPKPVAEAEKLNIIPETKDWYITSEHPMTKDHFISFVACVNSGSLAVFKQYPEWALDLRFPRELHGSLFWYCTQHGLFYQPLK